MSETVPRRAGLASSGLVVAVSGTVAFAIMGDSLLYGILPLAAEDLGLLPQQVGLLLSANRLIRLLSNTWLSTLFARFGPYRTFVVSAILGVLTTAVYGLGWGFLMLLMARMAWGVSWSGLRQGSYQAIWAGAGSAAGRLMGLMWGVVRGGSAVSVLLGGFLFDCYGYQVTVWTIAAISTLAIPIALRLSWPAGAQIGKPVSQPAQNMLQGWQEALSDPLQRTVLLVGFFKLLLNAILIATASLFLAERFGDQAGGVLLGSERLGRCYFVDQERFGDQAGGVLLGLEVGALAGVVLATRWFSDLFLGAVMGALADRIGHLRLPVLLILLLCLGLAVMLWTTASLSILALLGVLITSTGVNVILDAYANQLALGTAQPELFVGAYTTASDLGSALGPLLAFTLVTAVGFAPVYGVAALLVLITVLYLVVLDTRAGRRPNPQP